MKREALAGKVVLITGASSGIGWATALALKKRGCRLALAARREEKLRELSRILDAQGAETLVLPCDVGRRQDCLKAVETVIGRWGRLDILLNNAGILPRGFFHEQRWGSIEETMRVNVLGAAALTQAALPPMLKAGSGHVLNVCSVAGLVGIPLMSAYCASKFALVGLTESLRREYGGRGIAFTAFCPGSVATPMASGSLREKTSLSGRGVKSAEKTAEKIVDCLERRPPELIFAESPALLIKLTRFFPRTVDRLIRWGMRRALEA